MKYLCGLLLILCPLLFGACEFDGNWEGNVFAFELRGTWITRDEGDRYTGTIVITHDTISISGYQENQTIWPQNDNQRPFRNFIKDVAQPGYSKDGSLFIQDMGAWQPPVSYEYQAYGSFPREEILRFHFNNLPQVLTKIK